MEEFWEWWEEFAEDLGGYWEGWWDGSDDDMGGVDDDQPF